MASVKTVLKGFCEMKKKTGKVIFLEVEGFNGVHGVKTETQYLYDDLSTRINDSHIGKEIQLIYGAGYNGKAYVSDVIIK